MAKLYQKISSLINSITGIMLFVIVVTIFFQVIMRYILGKSMAVSEEMTRYLFVWLLYLGVHLGIRDEIQIKIDLLDLKLHGNKLKVLKFIQYVLSMVAIIALMIGSFYLIKNGRMAVSPANHIPMWMIYAVFPVGFVLDLIELGIKIWELPRISAK